MAVYILNFNNSRDPADIKRYYDNYGETNIDFLLKGFKEGTTNWSVPQKGIPGEIVVFMCAKTARANLGLASSHLISSSDKAFLNFLDRQKDLYKQYSGNIIGCGVIASKPEHDDTDNRWYADIQYLTPFKRIIALEEFKNFIKISQTNSITYINDSQWERLKWTINTQNPGFFADVIPPDIDILNAEFEEAVQKESNKSLNQLKKEAGKRATAPVVSAATTKSYHRDSVIAAYVKKRANGYCELCGQMAPFMDVKGEPYLESHHIEWLSKGGLDSADNCVALCPNCHRKMHIKNDPNDVLILKKKIN